MLRRLVRQAAAVLGVGTMVMLELRQIPRHRHLVASAGLQQIAGLLLRLAAEFEAEAQPGKCQEESGDSKYEGNGMIQPEYDEDTGRMTIPAQNAVYGQLGRD